MVLILVEIVWYSERGVTKESSGVSRVYFWVPTAAPAAEDRQILGLVERSGAAYEEHDECFSSRARERRERESLEREAVCGKWIFFHIFGLCTEADTASFHLGRGSACSCRVRTPPRASLPGHPTQAPFCWPRLDPLTTCWHGPSGFLSWAFCPFYPHDYFWIPAHFVLINLSFIYFIISICYSLTYFVYDIAEKIEKKGKSKSKNCCSNWNSIWYGLFSIFRCLS